MHFTQALKQRTEKVLHQITQFRVIMTIQRFESGLVLTAGILSRSNWITTRYFLSKEGIIILKKTILRNMLHMH